MSNGGFVFKIRTQFSFVVDDRTLSCFLSGIAKLEINITGYMQTKLFEINNNRKNISSNCNVVRLVVGSPDSENDTDIIGVRNVLDTLGINYQVNPVIQVLEVPPGVPGAINGIFGALWCKVIVNAIYPGEETRLFIDASDNYEALLILSESPLVECPKQCRPCSGVNCKL
jgi:hypothetical protein